MAYMRMRCLHPPREDQIFAIRHTISIMIIQFRHLLVRKFNESRICMSMNGKMKKSSLVLCKYNILRQILCFKMRNLNFLLYNVSAFVEDREFCTFMI